MFQRSGPLQAAVWDKLMRGLTTRNYGPAVKDFQEANGIEKSTVSEKFIEASREELKELMERPQRISDSRFLGPRDNLWVVRSAERAAAEARS